MCGGDHYGGAWGRGRGGDGGGTLGAGSVKAAKAAASGSTPADDEFAASYRTFLNGLMGRLTISSSVSAAGGAEGGGGGGEDVREGGGVRSGLALVAEGGGGGGDLALASIRHPVQLLLAAGVDRETLSKALPRLRIRGSLQATRG